MKHIKKLPLFIISAAMIISAFFGVFAEDAPPAWPYTTFTATLSEENQVVVYDDEEGFNKLVSKAVGVPFFALMRDYPDVTLWMTGVRAPYSYSKSYNGNKVKFALTKVNYTLIGNEKYGDPKGMVKQVQDVVNAFEPEGKTMYEKLLSIHDYICALNTYVTGADYCYSAYGSLVNRRSVCEGYAEAFKLLCDKAGITTVLVTGMSTNNIGNTEAHMWNYVLMDDGNWYAVDVTWDDAGDITGNRSYFLVGADTVVSGKKFTESHRSSLNLSSIGADGSTIDGFRYPTLSASAYDPENGKGDYDYDGRYYYSFLDNTQRELYDAMLSHLTSFLPSDPTKTPEPAPTDDLVSTTPEETTPPETTKPETTKPETTKPDTTKPDTTKPDTTKPDTTVLDTTKPPETDPPSTTTDKITEPTTTPSVSTTDKETEPTTTPPPVTSDKTTSSEDTTVTDAPTDSITDGSGEGTTPESSTDSGKTETDPTDTSTDTTTDSGNGSESDSTTAAPVTTDNNKSKAKEAEKLYRIVSVTVIASAIICLSLGLGFAVIRYAKKHGDEDVTAAGAVSQVPVSEDSSKPSEGSSDEPTDEATNEASEEASDSTGEDNGKKDE